MGVAILEEGIVCAGPRSFYEDYNDVIATVVINPNINIFYYSPQKEPHYDTVPEQEDSRPRFVFTHHHSHEVDVPFCLYHIKQLQIFWDTFYSKLCGSNSDFLWKDNPKLAMGCYAKPFSMSHKATPASVINRPRGHTKCQLWAYASILSINIIINTFINVSNCKSRSLILL